MDKNRPGRVLFYDTPSICAWIQELAGMVLLEGIETRHDTPSGIIRA
jgi:hypothetical protein